MKLFCKVKTIKFHMCIFWSTADTLVNICVIQIHGPSLKCLKLNVSNQLGNISLCRFPFFCASLPPQVMTSTSYYERCKEYTCKYFLFPLLFFFFFFSLFFYLHNSCFPPQFYPPWIHPSPLTLSFPYIPLTTTFDSFQLYFFYAFISLLISSLTFNTCHPRLITCSFWLATWLYPRIWPPY